MGVRAVQRPSGPHPFEQAKARLRAALKPDVNRKRIKRDNRILLRLIVPILLPFAGAALFALYPPSVPPVGSPWQEWLDVGFFALVALALLGGFIFGTNHVLTRWDHSHPDSPEDAIREFYRQANRRKPSARRMGALIAGFDYPGPRIRPVYHWLTAAAVPDVDSPRTVAKYWWALVHGNNELVRRLKIKSLDIESPCADVAVAHLRLRVTVVRRVQALLSTVVGLIIVIVPFALGAEFMRGYGLSFWVGVGAAMTLGLGLALLLRRLSRAVVERRDVEVSKLLVRTSYNWRLVSGEWESADESDLAWMQSFTP